MASATIVLDHIRHMIGASGVDGQSDRELLRRFTRDGDGQAFAALLRRHGPMVWAACRRILSNTADAEDVVQKTFLLLAQKAARLRDHDTVGGWLYGVAYRKALRARSEEAKRADREGRKRRPDPSEPLDEIIGSESRQRFHLALARLPERYRAVLVLCYLEGRTQNAAARQLGCSLSTLKRDLEEGRTRLGQLLIRHGVTLPAAALAVTLAARTNAALPPALTAAVLRAVTGVPVAGLGRRAVGGLLVSRRRFAVAVLAIPVALAAGALALWSSGRPEEKSDAPNPPPDDRPRRPVDRAGNPLPDGAIARIGTMAFRPGGGSTSLAFTADGKQLLSFPPLRVWDAATGREQRHLAVQTTAHPWVSFSSDGKLAATDRDGGATLWNLATGKKVKDIEMKGRFLTGLLSPDGRVLALARDEFLEWRIHSGWLASARDSVPADLTYTFETWDVATGERLATWQRRAKVPKPPLALSLFGFTGDGKTLMTGGPDHDVLLWEAATGKPLGRLPGIDAHLVLALSADGKVITSFKRRGPGSPLCIFDAADGELLREFEAPATKSGTWAGLDTKERSLFNLSPDGKVLACWGTDEFVYLWDVAKREALARFEGTRFDPLLPVTFSPDSKTIGVPAGVRVGSQIHLYDVASGKELPATVGLPEPASAAALTPDGKTLATTCGLFTTFGSSIELWDATTGEQRRRLEGSGIGARYLSFSPDGRTLFFTSDGGDANSYLWDVATGRQLQKYAAGNRSASFCFLASSPDWKRLAVWKQDHDQARLGPFIQGQVQVIDTMTGKRICDVGPLRTGRGGYDPMPPAGATFLPDGRSLVVCTEGKTIERVPNSPSTVVTTEGKTHVYDAATGKELRQIEFADSAGPSPVADWRAPPTAVFSPDGRLIAFRENGRIAVHELLSGAKVCRSEKLAVELHCLALSPDGRTVAWGGKADPLVHLLDVATGNERHAFEGHSGGITLLTFSADGKKLVSGSTDCTLLVWDLTAPDSRPESGQPERPISPSKLPTFTAKGTQRE
jgi:RNA polymerase sigma factor (sigma-70 family)